MMSTLKSSTLSLKSSPEAAPIAKPNADAGLSKRFATLMNNAQALSAQTMTQRAPQALPQIQATAVANPVVNAVNSRSAASSTAQTGPTSEAGRAEENARNNAKAAARMAAHRASIKAPGASADAQNEPQRAASDSATTESSETDDKKAAGGATLSADMAAWVAALNPAVVKQSAAGLPEKNAQASDEVATPESELAAQLVTQTTAQDLADKNTQLLSKADTAANVSDARQSAAQTAAAGASRAKNTSDTASDVAADVAADVATDSARDTALENVGSSRRQAVQAASSGAREAGDARTGTRLQTTLQTGIQAGPQQAGPQSGPPTGLQTAQPSDLQATAMWANGNASLNPNANPNSIDKALTSMVKELGGAASAVDFSSALAGSMNASHQIGNAGSAAAETLKLSFHTPVNAPEFREALGVQVSLLARDGVQSAELHLNPAEMGPVSIQIVMEGNQARVEFGADLAVTRAAIEAGMPELASALLDAGFTLAGGGVSQHAKGQEPADSEKRQGSSRRNITALSGTDEPTAQALPRRIPATVGGVDLYA